VLYGKGLALQHRTSLVEAMRTLEKARRLDPESAAIARALMPLYLALERRDEALACGRRALELEPADAVTAYELAQQLRARGKTEEAVDVLAQAAGSPRLKERPELRLQILFDLASLHEDAENWPRAHKRMRELADLLDNPRALLEAGRNTKAEIGAQAAQIHERLGRICLKQGKADEAIGEFRAALKADPAQQARLSYNLAEVLVSQGQLEEALRRLEDYLRTQPQGIESYELRAKLQRKLGQDDQVVPDLEAASGRDPNNTALKLLLAREYLRAEQLRAAERVYDGLLTQSPTPEVYEGLFALYRQDTGRGAERLLTRFDDAVTRAVPKDDEGHKKKGDPAQAAHARAMLSALRKDPELAGRLLVAALAHLTKDDKPDEQTRAILASLAVGSQHLADAEVLYRSCLEGLDQRDGRRDLEPEVYAGLLQVLELQHKYTEIVALAKRGLQEAHKTHRVIFHRSLALAYLSLKKADRALEAADNAVKDAEEANQVTCQLLRAGLLSQVGKHRQAIAACQQLLKKYNRQGDVHRIRHRLSSIYSAAHDYAHAEEQLQRVLDDDPSDATASNDLGYLWAERNTRLDEAERLIRKALELDREQRRTGGEVRVDGDSDNAAYVDSLGWVLFRRGRLDEARRELERATRMLEGGDDPVLWDHLGDVYFRMHETARARAAWKKALSLFELGTRYPDERLGDIQQKLRLPAP
jgi:tetratricopeptide (TPR) repeat protein